MPTVYGVSAMNCGIGNGTAATGKVLGLPGTALWLLDHDGHEIELANEYGRSEPIDEPVGDPAPLSPAR